MNHRDERHSITYILGRGENSLKLAAFTMKHLKNTGRSCDPASVYNPYVMLFKYQKRRDPSEVSNNRAGPHKKDVGQETGPCLVVDW